MRLCGEALRKHKDALGSLVALEMGKIKPEGDGEVQEMIDIADFALGQSRMLYGYTMHSERPGHRMYEQWHPLGIVGIISAFNFPVAVWAWNCVHRRGVRRHLDLEAVAEDAAVGDRLDEDLQRGAASDGGFPDLFFLFNDAGADLAKKFVDDHRVALISFTGSTAVGRHVGERVARRMGRSLLELGGNNAIIVDETADLKLAIPAIVFGAVGTAGQRCTSTRRLFVHESIYDDVVEHTGQRLQAGREEDRRSDPGDDADGSAEQPGRGRAILWPRSTKAQVGRRQGAASGGKALADRPGNFVLPTIIAGLKNSDEVVQTETFAPILYVMPFKSLDEAIGMHNGVPQGLSSAIFTQEREGGRSVPVAAPAPTAASPTSISAPAVPRSAARSAARRRPAAGASRVRTRGRPTCAGKPTRSTTPTHCHWRRGSSSSSERTPFTLSPPAGRGPG